MVPMLFGPRIRTPDSRAMASSRSWRSFPSAPVSAKPPASTVAHRTPAVPQERIAEAIESGAAIMMKAWSTGRPMSSSRG